MQVSVVRGGVDGGVLRALSGEQGQRQRVRNGAGEAVFKFQNLAGSPVKAIRPEMSLIAAPNELCRNVYMVPSGLDAAFQNILHPQFPGNVLDIFTGVLVRH